VSSTALSIPANAAAPASPAAPAPVASQPAATDFMILVQQMLGQTQAPPVASMPVTSETLQQAVSSEDDLEEGKVNECAGLAALLALLQPAGGAAPNVGAADDVVGGIQSRLPGGASSLDQIAGKGAAELLLGELSSAETTGEAGDVDRASFAPTAPEASSAASKTAHVEVALSRPVQAPVGSAAWSEEIAARLTLMTENGKHSASLRLSPEHLGPMEVRIAVNDDQASVWFGAAHADTRAAIEQALPRLRELFESQGLSLADAGVFREPPRDQPQGHVPPELKGDAASTEESVTIARARLGLVDAYA
jgi:flagellar hook-length control protein FliK